MKTKLLAALIALYTLASCGAVKDAKEASEDLKETRENLDEATREPDAEKSQENRSESAENPQENRSESAENPQPAWQPDYIVSAKARTWAETNDKAPSGFRLATRAELTKLHDEGELIDYVDPGELVWTATDYEDMPEQMAYGFSTTDGASFGMMKTVAAKAIYIEKEEEL